MTQKEFETKANEIEEHYKAIYSSSLAISWDQLVFKAELGMESFEGSIDDLEGQLEYWGICLDSHCHENKY